MLAAPYWPPLLTIGVGLLLSTQAGGFAGESWYLAALFLLALLALTLIVLPPAPRTWQPALSRVLLALGAFCAWALVSAWWSDVPAAAWDGANRAILYGVVLALATLRPWPQREYAVALGLVAGGIGLIAAGVLVDSALRAEPAVLFLGGRLSAPVGYPNATANLWLIGLWPALTIVCQPRLPCIVRSAFLGVSCLLLEISLLSVSRGAVASCALTALIFVALTSARWKVALSLAAVGGATALAAGPVLAVSSAATVTELEQALPAAHMAIVWTSGLVACLGAAAIILGRRVGLALAPDSRVAWPVRANRFMGSIAALGVVVALVGIGDPATWASDRWKDFKSSGYTAVDSGSGRLTSSLGSGRYDFYRVALNEFRERPLVGIGYENFQVPYLVHRRTDEAPRYPHSLAFGILSQLGLVGAALFGAFLAQALAMTRRALVEAGERRVLVAGALAGFTIWFGHGLVDWLWEFPALGILAFSLLGLSVRGCRGIDAADVGGSESPPRRLESPSADRAHAHARVRVARIIGAIAAVAVAASFTTLGVASRLTQTSVEEGSRDPVLALARLEWASRLDVLSATPVLTRGVIAQRLGDRRLAEVLFRDALSREPRNWFANFELGLAWATAGRREAALARLARAQALNPRQRLIDQARRRISRGQTVLPLDIERAFHEDMRDRIRSVP